MPRACEQCTSLKRQLAEIKSKISEEIGKGHTHRSAKETRPSLSELLDGIAKIQALYDRHQKDDHGESADG